MNDESDSGAFVAAHTPSATLTTPHLPVYKLQFTIAIPDPDMAKPRYHTTLFIPHLKAGSNNDIIYEVNGDLVTGMQYSSRIIEAPESQETFHAKHYLGRLATGYQAADVEAVCAAQTPPGRQKAWNSSSMRYEPCKPDGTFYTKNEKRLKLRKCTEWINEQVIPALVTRGLLDQDAAENSNPRPA
ncbi:MAG: hypothetical protein Q9159_000276 [Coniocarpon cinnabarinum]